MELTLQSEANTRNSPEDLQILGPIFLGPHLVFRFCSIDTPLVLYNKILINFPFTKASPI